MTAPPAPVALDLRRGAAADFAAAYERFIEHFLPHHPGYARVRPALLPLLLPEATVDALWRATRGCLATLDTTLRRKLAAAPDATLAALGYPDHDAAWLHGMLDPDALAEASVFARADFVLSADGPRLVEMNVGPTVGGLGILDRYADAFDATVTRLLGPAPTGQLGIFRPGRVWASCLRDLAPPRGADGGRLRLALVVADEEGTVVHPHEAAWYLRAEGVDADVVRVGDIRFDGAATGTAAGPVDLVYGCFTFDQLADDRYRAFVDAALAAQAGGGPRYLSPPLFTLLGNKALLTLADPADLPAWVPATVLAEGAALDHARACQDRYVLKPALGYGGDGVVIGARSTAGEWSAALARAADGPRRQVLQEYAAPIPVDMPVPGGTRGHEVGIGCISFGGELAGFLVRHAPVGQRGPINVTRGATFAGACVLPDAEVASWRLEGGP